MLTCGRVVESDEPLQVGLSFHKSSRCLADGRELGSGQHPKALRDFAIYTIDFHQFFVNFLTQENEHGLYILYSIVPIRHKNKLKNN